MSRERTLALIKARRAQLGARPQARRRLPRQLQPDGIRLEYAKAILRYVDRARAMLDARVYPRVRTILAVRELERHDAADDVNRLVDEVSDEFFKTVMRPANVEQLASQFAARTSEFQREELGKQVRAAVGVDVLAAESGLSARADEFVADNVALIKTVPNRMFDDIEKTITRGMREGRRWEELSRELAERHGVAESDARRIARDQVGKYFGELNKVRQQALGITHFIWRTVNDQRVRDSHAELEGQRFSWDDLPAVGPPGYDFECRCGADPDMTDLLAGL